MHSSGPWYRAPESIDGGDTPRSARDVSAWVTSLFLHALLVLGLGLSSFTLAPETFLFLSYDPVELPEQEDLTQEFLSSETSQEDIGALSQAGSDSARAATMEIDQQSLVAFEQQPIALFGELATLQLDDPVFQGPNFSEDLPVQGVGMVGTTGAVGAIDRITHEIIASLEQQKTLVVWLFDQSGSMKLERRELLHRMQRIYDELGVLEAANNPAFKKHKDKPLLTAVVGFGASSQLLTPRPTDQLEEIEAAIEAIQDNHSKKENIFGAVAMVAEKFRNYRSPSNGQRNVMLIVFTDESGDDISRLDATIDLCQKLAMPVYVVGRPAPFGRRVAYVKWVDPDPNFDQRPQWVPVSLGPESVAPERLKLHVLGSQGRDELLDSGYGPYSLTRLCHETGGIYFSAHPNRTVGRYVSRSETDRLMAHFSVFYSPETMRRYQPDYIPEQEYMRRLQKNRAKQALVKAAQLSWTSPIEDVRLRFPKRDEASLARSLSRAQRSAALLQPKIDRICQLLLSGEKQREALRSPRWKAGFDLALGRALATKVRCEGYNTALAQAKQGMAFRSERNNTWLLVAGETFTSSSLEKMAKKSRQLLEQVQKEHAETPWATLALQELQNPLGWRWKESYTYLPPPNIGNGNNQPARPRPNVPRRRPRRNPPPL